VGLIDRLRGGVRMKDPVRGIAQVVSCTAPHGGGERESCRMELMVEAEGVPATSVRFEGLIERNRWPVPGAALPVTVDRADPHSFRVEWDEVEPSRDHAPATDEGLAAALRAGAGRSKDDQLDRLERLSRLREQGALTDAEFEAQKKRILDE
jgi:Short C-terminal domain